MKVGLLRGVGQGISNLGQNRIEQDNKAAQMAADQAIWEARQARLQEMGLQSAEKEQALRDASAEKASAMEYEQKKGLLSAGTDEKIRLMEEAVSRGVDTSGKPLESGAMGKPSSKAKHQAELEAQGLPKDVARGIAYGTIKQIKDEYGMTTMLVDIAANNGKGATIGSIQEKEKGGYDYQANPSYGGSQEPQEAQGNSELSGIDLKRAAREAQSSPELYEQFIRNHPANKGASEEEIRQAVEQKFKPKSEATAPAGQETSGLLRSDNRSRETASELIDTVEMLISKNPTKSMARAQLNRLSSIADAGTNNYRLMQLRQKLEQIAYGDARNGNMVAGQ